MNEIVNMFFLVGDRFMPDLQLGEPESTYITCGPFTRNIRKNRKP